MVRSSLFARRFQVRGFASALALGVAFAGASVVGTALIDTPAYAQKKPKNSKPFADAYAPVAQLVNAQGGDLAAAKAQVPNLVSKVANESDQFAAGTLIVALGNKLNDVALQRQGLGLMIQSGQTPPETTPRLRFLLGNLAYQSKDYAGAITALQAASAAGYQDDNLPGLIFESYVGQNQAAQGVQYLTGLIKTRQAAGQPVPEGWLLRALKVSYEQKALAPALDVSRALLASNPTPTNWTNTLQVVNGLSDFQPAEEIDLLRLMLATNSLTARGEFASYIEAADPRIMGNEVLKVLQAGVQKGALKTTDAYYKEVKTIADQRAPADRRDVAGMAAEARKASSGNAAHNAGEVYLSMGSYAEAEAMYALALQKNVADAPRTMTRLGIAQAMQGKHAEADATFAKIQGRRAPIAAMWRAYVDSKS